MARCPEAAGQVDGAGAERAAGECGWREACTVGCGGRQRVQVWPSGSWASVGSGLGFVVPTVTVADGKGFPGPGFRDSLVPAWLCVGTLPLEKTPRGTVGEQRAHQAWGHDGPSLGRPVSVSSSSGGRVVGAVSFPRDLPTHGVLQWPG